MTQCFCSCQFEKFKKKHENIYKGAEANTREKKMFGDIAIDGMPNISLILNKKFLQKITAVAYSILTK